MIAPIERLDRLVSPENELSLALLQATAGLTEAAHSLSTLTQKRERAQKPAFFRRGLNRTAASEYIGVSATKFGQLVREARMPKPKKIDGRYIWDVYVLDAYFDDLDANDDVPSTQNPWN
jgi:hypothetical protein